MSKLNKRSMVEDRRVLRGTRVAGGMGALAARQDDEALLRRAVMASLLWDDLAYESGAANAKNIAELVAKVEPRIVADIAIEAREKQKLRHTPLFIAREMARYPGHNKYLDEVLPRIITRADMLSDFLALYFKPKKQPITNKVKKGLAAAFENFQEYHFAKYDRDAPIKLRDVMFLVRPKPANKAREELYKRIADRTLETPETWEVQLSSGKDKKKTFTDLIERNKLGGLAFLRNLRNIEQSGVDSAVVRKGFEKLGTNYLLPLNFLAAEANTTKYSAEIEKAMLASYNTRDKLPGHTVFVLDVSGSMNCPVSSKSQFNRIEVGISLAMLAVESCERATIYVTGTSTHRVPARRGFGLRDAIKALNNKAGWGGIYTRRCLEHIKADLGKSDAADRIVIFSDSQDCEGGGAKPAPFGKTNYIVDVSAHKHGINYAGVWTAEISGWSEHFLDYIRAYEGLTLEDTDG